MSKKDLAASVVCVCVAVAVSGCAALLGSGSKKGAPVEPGSEGYVDPGPWDGPVAQKHAGKVLFSSQAIALDASDDSSIYADYELGAPLFIRFFAKESPHNLLPGCTHPRAIFRSDVNGEHAGKASAYMSSFGDIHIGEKLLRVRGAHSLTGNTRMPITTPVASVDDKDAADVISKFTSGIVTRLREGKNTIRIVVDLDCGASSDKNPLYAEGMLNVTVKPGGVAEYLAKFGPQVAASPHPENEKLVPEIIEIMKAMPDWSNEDVLGARVTSRDWNPVRNELTGVLIRKRIDAVVVVHAKKEPNAEACRIFTLGFERDVAGGPLMFGGVGGNKPIPCSSAPK